MRRVIGFAIFFVAFGIILSMVIPNTFTEIFVVLVCMILGYNLFCG